MKKIIIFLLFICLFTACSNNKNETSNINEKIETYSFVDNTSIKQIFSDGKEMYFQEITYKGSSWSMLIPSYITMLEGSYIKEKYSFELPDKVYFLEDAAMTLTYKMYDLSTYYDYKFENFINDYEIRLKKYFKNVKCSLKQIDEHLVYEINYSTDTLDYRSIAFEDQEKVFVISFDYLNQNGKFLIPNPISYDALDFSINSIKFD